MAENKLLAAGNKSGPTEGMWTGGVRQTASF